MRRAPAKANQTNSEVRLSSRQKEVLELLSIGRRNSEIAMALYVSERTIKWHVTQLLSALKLSNRTALAAWFHRTGR